MKPNESRRATREPPTVSTLSGDPSAELIALICAQPGMAERLLRKHVDDGTGRCKVCSGGAQTGHYPHPCVFEIAATEAKKRGAR